MNNSGGRNLPRLPALGLALVLLSAACASQGAEDGRLKLPPAPDLRGTLHGAMFQVVQSEDWPAGLVPVFEVSSEKSFELRRLPPRGQENFTEPLFFALPPEDESRAADLAGHWMGTATNSSQSRHNPHWQLAIDGERVAGRFHPEGEYRVASVHEGTFRSNRLQLTIEYINDRYTLTGEWRDGRLAGTWRQLNEPEHGVWEAERAGPSLKLPGATETALLYEWRRGGERRYSIEPTSPGEGWKRSSRPLCRVWRTQPPQ